MTHAECWQKSTKWHELDETPKYIMRLLRLIATIFLILFTFFGLLQLASGDIRWGIASFICMLVWVSIGIFLRRQHPVSLERF